MTEQPWPDRDLTPDDTEDLTLPDSEWDVPADLPRTIPEQPGGGSLDLPEAPDDGGGILPVPAM